MTKRIPVTYKKETPYYAIVDDADYEELIQHRWYAHHAGKTGIPYARAKINGAFRYMHKLILSGEGRVDHVNNIALDNRRENLRPATKSQNNANANRRRDNKASQFKGVGFLGTSDGNPNWKRKKPWYARIKVDGKSIKLGYFETEIEAAKAYDAKAKELFGEFARTNF